MIFKIWLFVKDLYGSWYRICFHLGKLHVKDFRFFSNVCLYTCFFNCPSAHLFLCLYIDSPKVFDIEYSTNVNIEKNFAFFLIHHPQAPSPLQVRVRCTALDWEHWVGRLMNSRDHWWYGAPDSHWGGDHLGFGQTTVPAEDSILKHSNNRNKKVSKTKTSWLIIPNLL